MVDSVSVRFKNARVEKIPLNIRIQWNVGTACVSECVLKTPACRGLRVGPLSSFLRCHIQPQVLEHVTFDGGAPNFDEDDMGDGTKSFKDASRTYLVGSACKHLTLGMPPSARQEVGLSQRCPFRSSPLHPRIFSLKMDVANHGMACAEHRQS